MGLKRLLSIGMTLVALDGCSTMDTTQISEFYRQNPGVAGVGPTKVAPSYLLCAPGRVTTTARPYIDGGYRLLGQSDFQNFTAEPMRSQALAYAQQLGANLVVYSVQPLGQEIHPVTKTILESEGHNLTTTTVQQTATPSPYGVNTDPTKTTTITTYIPPKYRTEIATLDPIFSGW
jgi:hypothetical protein